MAALSQAALAEFASLQKQRGWAPSAAALVEQARSSNSALHSLFTWDDKIAAHSFRLQQARDIIKVAIRMLPQADRRPTTVTVRDQPRPRQQPAKITASVESPLRHAIQKLANEIGGMRWEYASIDGMDAVFTKIGALLTAEMADALAPKPAQVLGGSPRPINDAAINRPEAEAPIRLPIPVGVDLYELERATLSPATFDKLQAIRRKAGEPAAPVTPAPPIVQDRKCLKCGKRFRSEGKGNRLCARCGAYAAHASPLSADAE